MAGRELLLSEIALLRDILGRRDPDLVPLIERMDGVPLRDTERERVRRAIVDELCELPEGSSHRRALELGELLGHLGPA